MGPQERGSPPIGEHRWGEIEVEGHGSFRDAKLWPGGARGWDWNETGTRHRPGIQPADVEELLDHAPEVVVLSRGRQRRLQTTTEVLELLDDHGVEVVQEETGEAIDRYNDMAERGRKVAGLFHTTC